MKLTQNQITGLLEVKEGEIRQALFRHGFRILTGIVSPTVIGRLAKMGLIEWRRTDMGLKAFLTDAGEQALKQHVAE